jgi:hypothetical protein
MAGAEADGCRAGRGLLVLVLLLGIAGGWDGLGMVIEEGVMVRLLMDLMVAMMGWWRRGDLMEPCLLLLVLLLLLRLGMRCYMVAMLLLAGPVVLGQVVTVAMMLGVPVVVVWCGIVSGGGNRRRVVTGAKWTVRIGDVVRRHDLDDFWTLRSRCWTQKRPQIADLGLELVHGWLFFPLCCCRCCS